MQRAWLLMASHELLYRHKPLHVIAKLEFILLSGTRGMLCMGMAQGLKPCGLSHVLFCLSQRDTKSFDLCNMSIINYYIDMSAGRLLEAAL